MASSRQRFQMNSSEAVLRGAMPPRLDGKIRSRTLCPACHTS